MRLFRKSWGRIEGPNSDRNFTEKLTELTNLDICEISETEPPTKEHTQAGPRTLAHMEQTCNSISMCITQPQEQGSP